MTAVLMLAALGAASPGSGQGAAGSGLSNAGIARASYKVDSVFVDRTARMVLIPGGDFGSYLIAQLGVSPIPSDLRIRVAVDVEHIVLDGRISDLPVEARQALGAMLRVFPPETPIAGEIALTRPSAGVVRFRLERVAVNGHYIPEPMLQSVLWGVGRQFPVLTKSGRDLLVQIPSDGNVELRPGAVRLTVTGAGSVGAKRQPAP